VNFDFITGQCCDGLTTMESPFDRLAADEIHQILTLTGMTGLCVVLPRVSKEMKARAAAALCSMEHIEISPYDSVWHSSRDDHFTSWSSVDEGRCVSASQIPFLAFDEDNLWATSPWPHSKDALEAAAKMATFVANFKLVLSKTTALKSLFLEANFYVWADEDCEGPETVPLPAFSLATVASTLRTLSVRVKPSSQTLLDIVSSCHGLEELSWRLVAQQQYEGDSCLVLNESMVAALNHAKTACPNLTKLPLLDVWIARGGPGEEAIRALCAWRLSSIEDVRAFFALLRSWANLEYAAIDLVYSEMVITEAKAFAGTPGAFKGVLYILVTDVDNTDFDPGEFTYQDGSLLSDQRPFIDLVNEPQLKVRVEALYL